VLSWRTQANKQNDASDKPVEEWPTSSSSSTGVEYVRVKRVNVGKIMDNIIYKPHVIPSIGASEPHPIIDNNFLIRQGYT